MSSKDDGNSGLVLLKPGQRIKPNVSPKLAEQLMEQEFGYKVNRIKELNSYDDNNYYVEAINLKDHSLGKFVFKVLNSMDSKRTGHIEAENACMLFLSSKGINCPVPQMNKNGKTFSVVTVPSKVETDAENNISTCEPAEIHAIRLLSFVEGNILANVPLTKSLLYETGSCLAKLNNLLKDFTHSGLENHTSIWQIRCVPNIRQFLYAVENKSHSAMVENILQEFESHVEPAYPKLNHGVIHGDYNEQNILVQSVSESEYKIHGVIDFGDTHESYYLFEIAILLCYVMLECLKADGLDPFEGSGHALAGYVKFREMGKLEMDLLRTCIAARLCQSLVMGAYTYSQDPGNTYLLTTASRGWTLLNKLWNETTEDQIQSVWTNVVSQH